jgi:hypothetical protein
VLDQFLRRRAVQAGCAKECGVGRKAAASVQQRGTWGSDGAIRRVELLDGHYAFDHIIQNRQPDLFYYQVYGFTNQAARIASYIRAEFRYEELGPQQTRMHWTYSMRPKAFWSGPLVGSFVNNRIKPYMEAGMTKMAEEAAKAAAAAKGSAATGAAPAPRP